MPTSCAASLLILLQCSVCEKVYHNVFIKKKIFNSEEKLNEKKMSKLFFYPNQQSFSTFEFSQFRLATILEKSLQNNINEKNEEKDFFLAAGIIDQ